MIIALLYVKFALCRESCLAGSYLCSTPPKPDERVPRLPVLLSVAVAAGIPFVFFGFSDNAIMVWSGMIGNTAF
jgi:hypothetical protein